MTEERKGLSVFLAGLDDDLSCAGTVLYPVVREPLQFTLLLCQEGPDQFQIQDVQKDVFVVKENGSSSVEICKNQLLVLLMRVMLLSVVRVSCD